MSRKRTGSRGRRIELFSHRKAFTLVELLVVVAIIGVLIALLLPAINMAREASRRSSCSNNMRQLGLAMHNYEGAHRSYPPGALTDDEQIAFGLLGTDGVYAGGMAMMLPFLEQTSLENIYQRKLPWYAQSTVTAQAIIPTYMCPSNANMPNPLREPLIEQLAATVGVPIGGTFGMSTYIFCKGVNDAWCDHPRSVPLAERGMFDYDLTVTPADIRDGNSNTFCMGEGASGEHWPVCTDPECTVPMPTFLPSVPSQPAYARQWWIGAGNMEVLQAMTGFLACGNFGCTRDKLNKNPVTHFLYIVAADDDDCRSTLENPASLHRCPNFRSDHPSGGNFLMADGSVQYIKDTIDVLVYRAYSTMSGGESKNE